METMCICGIPGVRQTHRHPPPPPVLTGPDDDAQVEERHGDADGDCGEEDAAGRALLRLREVPQGDCESEIISLKLC